MKCWDLGGQSQYRQEWGRYTRGCDCIIFVVDAHAMHLLPDAKAGKNNHRLLHFCDSVRARPCEQNCIVY
jgi:ADP-ribosylation factor-like protein 8